MLSEETLIKVARLAMTGLPGEQEAALRILLSQGINDPQSLLDNEKLVWVETSFKNQTERELIFQCYFRITGDKEVTFIRQRGKKMKVEIKESLRPAFELLSRKIMRSWREEHDLFVTAFINKNELFSENAESQCTLSREEIQKIVAMSAGISPTIIFTELKA